MHSLIGCGFKSRLTSPAPKKRNVWSASVPPVSGNAAMSPASATAAVPYNHIAHNLSVQQLIKPTQI